MANKTFRLSDQVIGQIRELLQLSMLTRTHIVDNFRTLELEENDESPGKLILSEAYCIGWNKMVAQMQEDAEKKHERLQSTVATDEGEEETPVATDSDSTPEKAN